MACVSLRFIDELIHCRALFSENLPCTSLHLQRAGTGRIITSIESLHQMFQEWRNSIFGWLASGGRKTARGSACVWAGMCHASPWLVSASSLLLAASLPCSVPGVIATNWAEPNTECSGKAEVLRETRLWNRSACKWREYKTHGTHISNSTHSKVQGMASERLGVTSGLGSWEFCIFDFYQKQYVIIPSAGMLMFHVFVFCCQDD